MERSDTDPTPIPAVAELTTAAAARGLPSQESIRIGDRIDRYVIVGWLGEGGMGSVHAAYDPELDRRVALKLLHPHPQRSTDEERERVLREAKALARMSEPEVVAVYDVGVHAGRVWLAMEFVAGQTLRQWLASETRSWRMIVDAMVAAGRGLAAAHVAGVVHRDFKPDNVMVAPGGRVRVMDFGLARRDRIEPPSGNAALAESVAEATGVGAVVGTPAYMAPEQYAGTAIDARADQFAWCVTCWEALFGERPFRGATLSELAGAILLGEPSTPADPRRVPSFLRRALLRGLAREPDRRFADMPALLDAATRDPRGRQAVVGIAGVVAVGALAIVGVRHRAARAHEASCRDPTIHLAGAWIDDGPAEIRAALERTGLPYARHSADAVVSALGLWADGWMQVQTSSCLNESAFADPQQAARTTCLAQARARFDTTVVTLLDADERVVERALRAVARLPEPRDCNDLQWLASHVQMTGAEDPASERARESLARAEGLRQTARTEAAVVLVDEVIDQARERGDERLLAAALEQRAALDVDTAAYADAETRLREAWRVHLATGDDRRAAEVAAELVGVIGSYLAKPEAATDWETNARALLQRVPEDPGLAARLDSASGARLAQLADHDGAAAAYVRARERLLPVLGPTHPDVLELGEDIADIAVRRQDLDDAFALYTESLAQRSEQLGPDHPAITIAMEGLARIRELRGDLDGARTGYEEVLAIRRRAFPNGHAWTAGALESLGAIAQKTGDLATAHARYTEVLEIRQRLLGADHTTVGGAFGNLGTVEQQLGHLDLALEYYERATKILSATRGPDHPDVAIGHHAIATLLHERGDQRGSRARLEQALRIMEKTFGPDHGNVAVILDSFGIANTALGDYDVAIASHTRSLAIHARLEGEDLPGSVEPLAGLGEALNGAGRFAEAEKTLQRALAIREGAVPPGERAGDPEIQRIRVALARTKAGG